MATSYQDNVPTGAQSAPDNAAAPKIRTIHLSDLHDALQLGWEDFKVVPSHAIILCVIYPVLGLVLARAVRCSTTARTESEPPCSAMFW